MIYIHIWQVGTGSWWKTFTSTWAAGTSSLYALPASSRASNPRDQDRSFNEFYDLASEIMQHLFHHILWVIKTIPYSLWKETVQWYEYQEMRTIGGHLKACLLYRLHTCVCHDINFFMDKEIISVKKMNTVVPPYL